MLRTNKSQRAKIYFLFFLCLIGVLVVFRNELKLLFIPDPEKKMIYKHSFNEVPVNYARNIIKYKGFITENQGLQLLPGSSGNIIFSFDKEPHQGCLLRVWFYGDKGDQRPNAIKVSVDGNEDYQTIASNGNYIGAVFNLSRYVKGSNNFQILFEAKNIAPFTSVVFDSIEVIILKGDRVRPALPNLPKILGLVLLTFIIFYFVIKDGITRMEGLTVVFLIIIILLAAYLRWNELARIAGTILEPDVSGYQYYAKKMDLFSDNGFYSAQFEKREPLYIFMVKMFFLPFGISDTHLRFVSFVFSLVMIYLTYRIGKEWFGNIVGLSAAFILSVHPYLISLGARGYRAEWLTTLLLLFIYYGYIKTNMTSRWRVLITGFLTGCILLTRSECLPAVVVILMFYPFLARSRWNFKMVLITLVLGISLLMPHLYSIYKRHGTPFYTANQYARFYANREFMGKPGFPTKEEVIGRSMYAGPKITPLEYYFKLHTPWQFVKYNVVGFTKIYLKMPFSFISGRGNLGKVLFRLDKLKEDFSMSEIMSCSELSLSLIRERIWDNLMSVIVFATFILGLVLAGFSRYWMLYIYMVLFQVQTSFLSYLGLDTRLSVHSYPLIALCSGYAIYWSCDRLKKRIF
jgi:hypothetical protein